MAEVTQFVYTCDYDGCTNGEDGGPAQVTAEAQATPSGWLDLNLNVSTSIGSASVGGFFDTGEHLIASVSEQLAGVIAAAGG